MTRWLLGYPDRAIDALHDALRLSEELGHPLTTIITLWFVSWLHYQRGEREASVAAAGRLLSLSRTHGIGGWIDAAIVLTPASGGDRLNAETLAELHRRVDSVRGATWRRVFCLCLLAELYADAGLPGEGRRVLASIADEDRETFCAPEVQRIEGELLLRGPEPATDEAERCFRTAMALAGRRAEKSLELRAATRLARLWQRAGKRDEARRLLADVYGWFTEGFGTADLREAKALLGELSGS